MTSFPSRKGRSNEGRDLRGDCRRGFGGWFAGCGGEDAEELEDLGCDGPLRAAGTGGLGGALVASRADVSGRPRVLLPHLAGLEAAALPEQCGRCVVAAADERRESCRAGRWVFGLVLLGADSMSDDFSRPVRDDFEDWRSSVDREWERWDRLRAVDEAREKGDDKPEADGDE